jgi:hypothetical protein
VRDGYEEYRIRDGLGLRYDIDQKYEEQRALLEGSSLLPNACFSGGDRDCATRNKSDQSCISCTTQRVYMIFERCCLWDWKILKYMIKNNTCIYLVYSIFCAKYAVFYFSDIQYVTEYPCNYSFFLMSTICISRNSCATSQVKCYIIE